MSSQSLKLVVATLLLSFLVGAVAEAGPKWRLRRWSSRPPIDPTIRATPSFNRQQVVSPRSQRYVSHYKSRRFVRGR